MCVDGKRNETISASIRRVVETEMCMGFLYWFQRSDLDLSDFKHELSTVGQAVKAEYFWVDRGFAVVDLTAVRGGVAPQLVAVCRKSQFEGMN